MQNLKSKAWDEIGGLFWTKGRVTARPTQQEIDTFLKDYKSGDECLVLGASTFYLIEAAAKKGMNVTVVDFSQKMINDLLETITFKIETKLLDVLSSSLVTDLGEKTYDLIICDRLINRFVKDQIPSFFKNIKSLIKKDGSFRASVKIGLYPMDNRILALAKKNAILQNVYDEETNTINFTAAEKILDEAIVPHGAIDRKKLFKWYVGRGKETRFTKDALQNVITDTGVFKGFKVSWLQLSKETNTVMLCIN